MSDIYCVTNRSLCREDFPTRLRRIAACRPAGIILREKDLSPEAYARLARQIMQICREYQVPCILHSFTDAAMELGAENIHLPMPLLRELDRERAGAFRRIGASCHSAQEAMEAQKLGCSYITAGHIFDTGCKQGVPGRGTAFLKEVCQSVSIPVYAIGGITEQNAGEVRRAGAKGVCIMSGLMQCADVEAFFHRFQREGE